MITEDIKLAAATVGVTPARVHRVVVRTGNVHALWCAHYAFSQGFSCNPSFTHEDSVRYADTKFKGKADV